MSNGRRTFVRSLRVYSWLAVATVGANVLIAGESGAWSFLTIAR